VSNFTFRNLPVTKKLMLIMHVATLSAVVFAALLFSASEALNYKKALVEQVTTLGDVIGTSSAAAITFEDEDLASQVLSSLTAYNDVICAQLHLANGEIFAKYQVNAGNTAPGSQTDPEILRLVNTSMDSRSAVERFEGLDYLDAVRPIFFDTELIGFLHLRTSLNDLVATLQRIAVVAGVVVLLAALVAYLLSFRLQAAVTRPILSLRDLMQSVTAKQDYSLRAQPSSGDEIGALMAGFNDMLEQINLRDVQLAQANERLMDAFDETLRAKEAAEHASSAKSDFLARMSHEIRTPMNGVLGMTELLMSGELKDSQRKFAETIQQSGEALLAIINDILDFSKVEAGKLVLEESDFDVCDAVEGIVDLLYNHAQQKGVGLICAIDPDVTPIIYSDPIRVRQVLMNLVGNAIKFTGEGEVVVRLQQHAMSDGESELRFVVEDTGIGIEQEHAAAIFESFAQADISTTREYGGTGLGLAISKQLVDLMGGKIGLDSAPGKGSAFWFTLPVVGARDESAGTMEMACSLRDVRVLVVDDNATNREVLERQLGAWDMDVSTANNAADAMAMLVQAAKSDNHFDLVLLDFFMPETDGLELAAAIRSRTDFERPGVIMLSSAGPNVDPVTVHKQSIDLYLAKPVRRAVLCESINYVLNADVTAAEPFEVADESNDSEVTSLGLTVLLVEDIPINMQVAQHMLYGFGCQVLEATNGQQALEVIAEQRPDVVLMDCQMPVMDGYTATRAQRAREEKNGLPRLPIIALTANALAEDRQKCLDAGMDDFVSKPFSTSELRAALMRWKENDEGVFAGSIRDANVEPANDPDIDGDPVIDQSALDQIAELDPGDDGEFVNGIIDTFVENAEVLMLELSESVRDAATEEATRAAHSLKSSSANVGARRFSNLCAAMEKHGREGDLQAIVDMLDTARTEYRQAIKELIASKTEAAA